MDTFMVVSTMATAIIGTMANLAIVITISKGATATLPSIMAAAMVGHQVTVEAEYNVWLRRRWIQRLVKQKPAAMRAFYINVLRDVQARSL